MSGRGRKQTLRAHIHNCSRGSADFRFPMSPDSGESRGGWPAQTSADHSDEDTSTKEDPL